MEKRISFDTFMSAKRVAQACNPLMVKRNKIAQKIKELDKEYAEYDAQISALEAGIKQITGFRVEELVTKVIEPSTDKLGNPVKTTKYIPTSIVSYDKENKQYVISIVEDNTDKTDEVEEAVEEPVEESAEEKEDEPVEELGSAMGTQQPKESASFSNPSSSYRY